MLIGLNYFLVLAILRESEKKRGQSHFQRKGEFAFALLFCLLRWPPRGVQAVVADESYSAVRLVGGGCLKERSSGSAARLPKRCSITKVE